MIPKNRLTQYTGPASAYAAMLRSIETDVRALMESHPSMFSFAEVSDVMVDIRDFRTTGVVAFARGCLFYGLHSGRLDVMGHRVQVNEPQRIECVRAGGDIVAKP